MRMRRIFVCAVVVLQILLCGCASVAPIAPDESKTIESKTIESKIFLRFPSSAPAHSKFLSFGILTYPSEAVYCTAYAKTGAVLGQKPHVSSAQYMSLQTGAASAKARKAMPARIKLVPTELPSLEESLAPRSNFANKFKYCFPNFIHDSIRIELAFYDEDDAMLAEGALLISYSENFGVYVVSEMGEGIEKYRGSIW